MAYTLSDIKEYIKEQQNETSDTHEYFRLQQFTDVVNKIEEAFESIEMGLYDDDIKEAMEVIR
jgi:DNA-binding transcriptional MerR regulator